MAERFTVTPERYALFARIALVMFTLIVVTGVAVRVTGSGLGVLPTWPKCTAASLHTALETHAYRVRQPHAVELGRPRRAAAFIGAFRRRLFRRDLTRLGVLLPLGVVGQILLGGFTVRNDLAPGFVMGHYMLSMLILVGCVLLDWRARREPGSWPPPKAAIARWRARRGGCWGSAR